MDAKSPQLCPTLCDPMDCSPPGSCVHGVFQARYWSGLPCLPPGDLPHPGMEPASLPTPVWAGGFFTTPAEQPYRCSVHLAQQVGLSLGYLHPVQNGSAPHFLDAKAMCNSPNGVSAGERFPTDCLKNESEGESPMDHTVHGVLQARILEWVAFPFSRGSSHPKDGTQVSCMAGRFFTSWTTREFHVPISLLSGTLKSPCW